MPYSVKEIFYTLQGEGAQAGRPAVFVRFSGCNLWSGLESDRNGAICQFCDTDFVGIDGAKGGRYKGPDLADVVLACWPGGGRPLVVCTGGEPLLQLDAALTGALHERGFEVAIETNGTMAVPAGVDWVCVSPKANALPIVRSGQELKLVYPQVGADPEPFESWNFRHFFLQPLDGPQGARNAQLAAEYCLAHPTWRLSLQIHKILGLP